MGYYFRYIGSLMRLESFLDFWKSYLHMNYMCMLLAHFSTDILPFFLMNCFTCALYIILKNILFIIFEIKKKKKKPFLCILLQQALAGLCRHRELLGGKEFPWLVLTSILLITWPFCVFRLIKMEFYATRTGIVHWLFKCKC